MPGSVKVKVVSARNLPIMDRSSFLADAFVELYIGNIMFKTEVCRRSLNPVWNSDWFCFELDDQALQEEALLLKVMDHDTYSSHDTIGRVYFDLNPLLNRGQTRCLNGWFPIYDTMHGIRGEINLAIRVDIFLDANLYRQSSLGVHFFHSCSIPEGYSVDSLIGFVQELVMNDDPEHQWIEKIRTSRASNEARQRLFSRLSGQLQRKIGLKVLNLGGNSVIGYQLHFDLEGETGVVVRGIGTAVRLRKCNVNRSFITAHPLEHSSRTPHVTGEAVPEMTTELIDPSGGEQLHRSIQSGSSYALALSEPLQWSEFPFLTISQPPPGMIFRFGSIVSAKSVKLMATNTPVGLQFRDAWWTELRTEVSAQMCSIGCNAVIGYREECAAICDDVCILSNYGTAVLLETNFLVSPPAMDRLVIGSSSDVGSASSTGAVTNDLAHPVPLSDSMWSTERLAGHRQVAAARQASPSISPSRAGRTPKSKRSISETRENSPGIVTEGLSVSPASKSKPAADDIPPTRKPCSSECSLMHLPPEQQEPLQPTAPPPPIHHHHHQHHRHHQHHKEHWSAGATSPPSQSPPSLCGVCQSASVPDLLLASVELPREVKTLGRPALIQARISRSKKEVRGEAAANELSELLPFIEYELHYRLLQKLRLRGMNAVFGLRLRIAVGDFMLAAVATGTGVFAVALPVPPPPKVFHDNKATVTLEDRLFRDRLQLQLNDYLHRCRQVFGLDVIHERSTDGSPPSTRTAKQLHLPGPETSRSESVGNQSLPSCSVKSTLSQGSRETVFLETREPEPEELAVLLRDPIQPMGLLLCTTESVPPVVGMPVAKRTEAAVANNNKNNKWDYVTWLPAFSFVRIHEAELSTTDSFFECSSFINTSDPSQILPTGSSLTNPGSMTVGCQASSRSDGSNSTSSAAADVERQLSTNCLSYIMNEVNQLTWFRMRHMLPCALTALDYRLTITDDQHVQVVTAGMVLIPSGAKTPDGTATRTAAPQTESGLRQSYPPATPKSSLEQLTKGNKNDALAPNSDTTTGTDCVPPSADAFSGACLLTPLSHVPGSEVEAYLGNLDFFFVRETTELRELGGICSFLHASLSEVQAVVSAHTASLGGNALLSYHLSEVAFPRPSTRNHAQCLFNVCGDMARLSGLPR